MKKIILNTAISTIALAIFAQISFAQTVSDAEKTKLANELVEITFKAFPMEVFQNELDEMKTKSMRDFNKEITNTINSKIDGTSEFSVEKKAAVKAKVPAFMDKMTVRVETLLMRDLNLEQWIKESLFENYTNDLTAADLQKINAFFKSPSGTAFFELVKEEAAASVEKRASKAESMLKEKDAVEIDKFMKTEAGTKFMATFSKDADSFFEAKAATWSEGMLQNLEKDMESGELNKLLVGFITENFGEN